MTITTQQATELSNLTGYLHEELLEKLDNRIWDLRVTVLPEADREAVQQELERLISDFLTKTMEFVLAAKAVGLSIEETSSFSIEIVNLSSES